MIRFRDRGIHSVDKCPHKGRLSMVFVCACARVKPCLFRYDEMRARRLQLVQTTEGPVPLEGGERRVGLPLKKKKSRHMGPRRRKTRSLK